MIKQAATSEADETPTGNIATRSYNKLKGTYDELDPNVKKLLGTGLGGAALGGGLGYLLTGNRAGESESARRKRVLANALLGAGLGGLAGTAIPAGLSSIEQASQKSDMDKLEDALLEYAPPAAFAAGGGAGAGIGLSAFRNRQNVTGPEGSRTKARKILNAKTKSDAFSNIGGPDDDGNVRKLLSNTDPKKMKNIRGLLDNLGISTSKKLVNSVGNPTDFNDIFAKLQRNRRILGRLGTGAAIGGGGLAGLGLYESLLG
tara:strand:+ start:3247 stop:4026 length:780 start_codon:yes stop_codon:yes gene_type:complete